MLWSDFGKFTLTADPFEGLQRLQNEMSRLFDAPTIEERSSRLPMNLWCDDEQAIAIFEVPGVTAADIDITVTGDTVTVKGARKPEAEQSETRFHRRERRTGEFARSIELPFAIDPENVQAEYVNGQLKVVLPRAAGGKPRKIAINN